MTDTLSPPPPPPPPRPPSPDAGPARACCRKRKFAGFLFLLIMIAALAAGSVYCPWLLRLHGHFAAGDIAQMQQRVATLENRVDTLSQEVNDLSARNAPAPLAQPQQTASAPATPSAAPSASTVEIAHMQSDLVSLSSAVSALQSEVKRTGSHADEAQQQAQASLAAAIAFIQLREAADTGHGFTKELDAMRAASQSDPAFQEQLAKLEGIAAQGAPTVANLRDELINQEPGALLAVDKAGAQNWWQRLLAELQSLVSVRKLHGGDTDAFTAMESDLAKGDVTAALTDMQKLPPEAQDALAGWQKQAEARQTADSALAAMADHFTVLANPPAATPAVTPAPAQTPATTPSSPAPVPAPPSQGAP